MVDEAGLGKGSEGHQEVPRFEAEGRPPHDWFADGKPIVLRLFPEYVMGIVPVFPQSDDTGALIPEDLSTRLTTWNDFFNVNYHYEKGWQSEKAKVDWSEDAVPLVAELKGALEGKAELVVDLWPVQS